MPTPTTGFTYGTTHGATYGTTSGGTYGEQTEERYRVRLTTSSGRRADIRSITSVDLALEHTAVSDLSLEIPRFEGLREFRFADMDLYYGDRLIFQATVEIYPGSGTPETSVLEGRGPGRSLTRGEIVVDYSGWVPWEAIRDCWDVHTGFSATVYEPATPKPAIEDGEMEGTPLEVLQTLHDRAAMRFTIQHTTPGRNVESYEPGALVREATWTSTDDDSTGDVTGYANHVIVKGGIRSDGTRPRAEAEDAAEIDAVGRETWPITDHTLTTQADCQARADTELAERLNADTFSGSIEIIPSLVLPGYRYQIPEWGGVELPVDTVSYSESLGEASATLEVNAPEGIVDALASLGKQTTAIEKSL